MLDVAEPGFVEIARIEPRASSETMDVELHNRYGDRMRVCIPADGTAALGFTRAHITQLVDLLLIAPEILEEILVLEPPAGAQPVSDRAHGGACAGRSTGATSGGHGRR